MALVLLSLPNQYENLQTIYNAQKDKWNINELIAICVQEEEKIKIERPESANLTTTSKAKKRKMDKVKEAAGVPPVKVQKKQDEEGCFFCEKSGHLKKEYVKYKAWRVKKGNLLIYVCSEVNLTSVSKDTWWVDSGTTTHVSVSMQGCL